MLSSTSCCNPKELASSHLSPALAQAPEQATPAHHGAARPTGPTADLLVVGDIVTNNPAAPTAEAMGAVSSSRTTVGQFWYALGLAGSTVLIDGLTRNAVANKLGPSAGTELEQWSASGGKPSNTSVLPDAAFAFSASFAVTMVVLAVTVVIAGIAAFLLLKRFQHGDPPHTHDRHPPVEATSGP
jgi:hypothetical protein